MTEKHATAAPVEPQPPTLTEEQIEAAVLMLLDGRWNSWSAFLARPEKIKAARKRAARAVRAEEFRQVEAPANIAAERFRRGT